MKFIRKYPTATAGLALGLSTTLWIWSELAKSIISPHILLIIAFVIALSLILPIILRFCTHPKMLLDELKDPTVGSVTPTLTLTLMIIGYFTSKVSILAGCSI